MPSFKPEVMGKRKEFEIAFVGLKPGIHEFTFEVDDKFFAGVETRDFTNCTAFVKLQLDKKTGLVGKQKKALEDEMNNCIKAKLEPLATDGNIFAQGELINFARNTNDQASLDRWNTMLQTEVNRSEFDVYQKCLDLVPQFESVNKSLSE